MTKVRSAVVRDSDGYIENVITRDDALLMPEMRLGFSLVDDPDGEAETGGTYAGGTFSRKPEPPDPRTLAVIKSAAKTQVEYTLQQLEATGFADQDNHIIRLAFQILF